MSDFYNKYPYTDFHELNLDWVIERVKKLTEDWAATLEEWNNTEEQWQQLYDYVHDYFDNLDVQQEINNKINAMIADGTFVTITTPVIEAKVASMMPATVASQIGDTVASQIGATVAAQIDGAVAGQINTAVIDPVNTWLSQHITQPTTPAIDSTLSIIGAAADSANTGLMTAPVYSSSKTYHINDYVNYNGTLYRCIEDITTPENWDSSHWAVVELSNDVTLDSNTIIGMQTGSVKYTKGNIKGYYNGTNVVSSSSYTCIHLTNNGFYRNLDFEILTAALPQAYVTINGVTSAYQIVNTYDIDVSDASDIWINFFGPTYCAEFILTVSKCINPSDYVTKPVYDNQRSVFEYFDNHLMSKDSNKYNILYVDDEVNNIICPYDVKHGYYVNTDGEERTSPDWALTPYIPVTAGESLYFGRTGLTCFYDYNYNFLSYRTGSYTAYTVPADAAFMKVSITEASLSTAQVNRGSTELPHDDGIAHYYAKKPYQSGYIFFTVPVNQYNWNRDANMGTANQRLDDQDWVDVNCYIKLPSTYTRNGKPTKLLMVCHGAGKGVNTSDSPDTWCGYEHYDNLISAFVSNGYAVFDCNGYNNTRYSCSFWGNRRGIQAWKNAYQYIINNYNVEHQFSIYGFSMGGLTALAIAADLYPNIKCVALGSPVTSIKAMWDEGNNGMIADIYGMASSSVYDATKVLGCDPLSSIITIGGTDYYTKQLPPIKAWFGTLETQPSPTDCASVIDAIKNTNGLAQLRMVENGTHSLCFGANPNITAEFVIWINRWNSLDRSNP